ncbi:MAG: 2-phosphosulfolactate phosphatase [Cyanobacteria bacterium P01_A01_bin.3]
MKFDQADFDIRCEWGQQGISQLAPISDVVIIVDALSFSTSVDIATSRGAIAFPYQWRDGSTQAFADSMDAELAQKRGEGKYSLSPASLLEIPRGTRLVLPSPNGSSLSLATGETPTIAGCLRNAKAVASAAMRYGQKIAVIPAGERWSDCSLRPALEDWIGAGAVLSYLEGRFSPEAKLAVATYQNMRLDLEHLIKQCGSGQELINQGFEQDVHLALQLNTSDCVPTLVNGSYINRAGKEE